MYIILLVIKTTTLIVGALNVSFLYLGEHLEEVERMMRYLSRILEIP